MTILVTGAAGFIGFHTSKALLDRGATVIGIDNLNDYYDPTLKHDRLKLLEPFRKFCFVEADFSNMAELQAAIGNTRLSHIIHLGAQPGVRYSIEHPGAYIQSNLVGHANILELARHTEDLKHLVYASSSSVYGGRENVPFSESDRVDTPVSLYAATKKADELLSQSYAHLYRIPTTGLRFFTVYGPWGRPDMAVWLFTKAIIDGKPIQVFNHGNMARDFTYVDDVIKGILAILDTPPMDDGRAYIAQSSAPHRILNIGNNRPENLMDFIHLIEELANKKAHILYKDMQPGDVKMTAANTDLIHELTGFKPSTSLKDGLRAFYDWYCDYMSV